MQTYRNGKWYRDGEEIVPTLAERAADRIGRAAADYRLWCYRHGVPRILWEPRRRMEIPALGGSVTMRYSGDYNIGALRELDQHNASVDRRHDEEAIRDTEKAVSELVRSGGLDRI